MNANLQIMLFHHRSSENKQISSTQKIMADNTSQDPARVGMINDGQGHATMSPDMLLGGRSPAQSRAESRAQSQAERRESERRNPTQQPSSYSDTLTHPL